MKKIIVLTVFLCSLLATNGQEWIWSNQLKCDGEVMTMDVITDDNNNVYLAGYYSSGMLTIGDSTLPDSGSWDGFICKFDAIGNVLWLNHIAGGDKDEIVSLIIIESDLYVAGNFSDNIYFTATDYIESSSPGKYDCFLAKYDLNGNYQESFHIFSGDDVERIKDFIYNPHKNEFVFNGQFQNQIKYATETNPDTTVDALSQKDLFIASTDFSGVVHMKTVHTTSVKKSIYNDVNLCQDEGYYLTGDLFGNIYFPSLDTIYGNSATTSDAVIVRLDTDFNVMWARKGGSTGYDHVNSAVSDQYGNIYITGQISGTNLYFDKNATAKSDPINTLAEDMYIAKYNKGGNLTWIRSNGNTGKDNGYGLFQLENQIQFCGNTSDEVIFNGDTLTSSGPLDLNTGFAIYDINGNAIGAQGIGGLLEDKGNVITFDHNRNTIISGYFKSTSLNIGEDSTYSNPSGATHGFIASYFYPFKATFTTIKNVTCNGGANGKLLASNYFGVAPYIYDWSASTGTGVYNDSLASNLTAGFYSLTVTDDRGDKTTINYTITEPSPFVITTDSTNISCYGANNGTLTAGASGNTAPYIYNWAGQNAEPFDSAQTGLEPGKYMLTVFDKNGCSTTDSVTITEPQEILFAGTTVTNEDPAGSYTGSIDLSVAGGTLPYSYSWEDSLGIMPGRVDDTLNTLREGFYIAHILDGNGCSIDTTILVPGETFRVLLIESNGISCFGFSDGQATARIASGDLGESYIYTFTDSIGTILTAVNDTIIDGLTKGWYYVTAQETGGGLRTAVDSILFTQPDSLVFSLSTDSIACYGDNNGAITLVRTGGTSPIAYSWSNGAVTQSISLLEAGWYTLSATDNNGCMAIDSAEVIQNDSLEIGFTTIQEISCYGGYNGILQADIAGGVGPFTYSWDDPGSQTLYRATGLGVGSYSVTITDSKGCMNANSTAITQPEVLSILSIDSTNVTCRSKNDGKISVTMTGGTEPYTYDWSDNSDDTNAVANLAPKLHTLIVKDAKNCVNDMLEVLIKEPAVALTLSEDTTKHLDNNCYNESLGGFTIVASGGWASKYEYSVNQIDWQDSAVFNGLGASLYEASVRDNNGCIVTANVTVKEAPEIIIASEIVIANTIIVSAAGGTPSLQYTLNGDGTPQSMGQFNDLPNGTYFVEITDANGCGPIQSNNLQVGSTGINESKFETTNIYPNPSNGLFKLEILTPSSGKISLEIFSLTGIRVYEENIIAKANEVKEVNLDISDHGKGIYLVNINGNTLQTKLIIE